VKLIPTNLLRATLALALLSVGSFGAVAQSANVVGGPGQAGPLVPPASAIGKLPGATMEQFTNAERLAGTSSLAGSSVGPAGTTGAPNRTQPDSPMAYGTSTAPYSTTRVALWVAGPPAGVNTSVVSYPFRPTGKLYYSYNGQNFICSASLISKGVLVTAAHCVFSFGRTTAGWHGNFTFCPANTAASGSIYGCWAASNPYIATSYYNGTDTCTQAGVVCNNDVAVLRVLPKNGVYLGNSIGWYNYSWNGYSYRASSFLGNVTTVQVAQLGYPRALDSGYIMERTDAVGWYFASGNLKNTQIGSAQTGGSSGGPWLVNLGSPPVVSEPANANLGTNTVQTIVGVTSYGSTTVGFNRQGSSFFGQNLQFPAADYGGRGAGNIGALVNAICTAFPAHC
jgi:V8-like Glu-specific endopeptidase